MFKQFAVRSVFLFAALAMVSGCAGIRGRRAAAQTQDDPWDIYPDAIAGDLVQHGAPFASTHTPMRDARFEAVLFGFDSYQIPAAERSKADEVFGFLKSNPGVVLVVEGHCDERGSREYNLALGERRALAARAYLIGLGIESDRLQTKSFGFERPAVDGHDESAWRYNRRAEFVISY